MWRVLDLRQGAVALLALAEEAGIDPDELVAQMPEAPGLRPALAFGGVP